MTEQHSTCDYCGEEHPLSLLEQVCNDYMCVACKMNREAEQEPEICGHCNGSGEGRYDGSRCMSCKGAGVEQVEQEEDEGNHQSWMRGHDE